MKRVMLLMLLVFMLVSIAAGAVVAEWVTKRSDAATVIPAVETRQDGSGCPGQTGICPASGKRRATAALEV